jgi:5-deoxy-glucuronate isomerase
LDAQSRNLLIKARPTGAEIVRVTPNSAGWRYVGFSAHRFERKEALTLESQERELCVVVLSGVVTVRCGKDTWREIGERANVFEGRSPYAVYIPHHREVGIEAHTAAEIALASAPGYGRHPPRLIEPSTMRRSVRGVGANTRFVCDILPETEQADHLLVVEVTTPASHSSSYPPHKHDMDDPPHESALEEIYYHRVHPSQGFVFQRVYTGDRSLDESMAAEDQDVVLVPRGYHPVCVPYGYDSYYLNVMAGPKRAWRFRNDPAHEWLLSR